MKLYYFYTLKALWDDQSKIKMYYGMSRVNKKAIRKKVYCNQKRYHTINTILKLTLFNKDKNQGSKDT